MAEQEMDGVRLFVGIPSYSWAVSVPTLRSLVSDLFDIARRGARFTLFDEACNTEIGAARLRIANAFLGSNSTHLLFVDDDLCWQAGGIARMIGHEVDFVGGVYPKRKTPLEWPVEFIGEMRAGRGLREAAFVPGGFMLLSRRCVQAMADKYGDAMFENIRHANGRYSEDISFCHRWRELGCTIWADVEIRMGHIGPKMFGGQSYAELANGQNGK